MFFLATNCLKYVPHFLSLYSMLIRNDILDVFMSNKPIPVMSFAVVTLADFIGLVTANEYSFKISQ